VHHFRRTATADVEFGGKQIKEDDKLATWYISGNFDEEVFPDPLTFDVGRDPNPQMTFGPGGPHFCTGAHLARLEIQIVFEEMVSRVADFELTGEPERLQSNFFNGIKRMPIRLTPA
jgi:cholest-4-en-3-one 26-monooxygenase